MSVLWAIAASVCGLFVALVMLRLEAATKGSGGVVGEHRHVLSTVVSENMSGRAEDRLWR